MQKFCGRAPRGVAGGGGGLRGLLLSSAIAEWAGLLSSTYNNYYNIMH